VASTLRRSIVTLALAAGLATGTAGTAAAADFTHFDKHRDVLKLDNTTNEVVGPGDAPAADVWRTTVRHNDNRIIAKIKLADLRRVGIQADLVRVVTNEGIKRDVTVFATKGMWRGLASMSRPNGQEVKCDITHKIDYAANTIVVSFPRSCVSNPRWIRVGVGAVWGRNMDDKYFYADDAQRVGAVNKKGIFQLSPRIRRG
jgi:hypothetical protein